METELILYLKKRAKYIECFLPVPHTPPEQHGFTWACTAQLSQAH